MADWIRSNTGHSYFTVSACCVLSAWLLAGVVPSHWSEDDHGKWYLDTYGLGASCWGVAMIIIGLYQFSHIGGGDVQDKVLDVVSPNVPSDYGLTSLTQEAVFKDGVGIARVLKIAFLLVRTCINLAFITWNFHALPARDPNERLNQAKHIVTWIEFPFIWISAAVILLCAVAVAAAPSTQPSQHLEHLVGNMHTIATFSVLKALPQANPMSLLHHAPSAYKKMGSKGVVAVILAASFMAPTAVMALLVKISQIDFVTEELYSDWSVVEWLRLVSFINNITGIIPESTTAKIKGVLMYVNSDPRFVNKWQRKLYHGLVGTFGKCKGIAFCVTLSAEDICQILNTRRRHNQPEGACPGADPDATNKLASPQLSRVSSDIPLLASPGV